MLAPDHLTCEQLAALCCYRRQQVYRKVSLQEAGRAPGGSPGRPFRLGSLRRRAWAVRRGWTPELARGQPAAGTSAGTPGSSGGEGSPLRNSDWDDVLGDDFWGEESKPAEDVEQLKRLEQQLEAQLMAGRMQRPALLTAPHPMCGLPKELVLRILQLAAYPLSAWVQAQDWQLVPAAADAIV